MARRKLTNEERSFRKIGAGIPFSRWWPVVAISAAIWIAMLNPGYVAECTGIDFQEITPRETARVSLWLAYPCSPYLIAGGLSDWLIFLALWLPWPFAVANWRWHKRHRKFWDNERKRESERRKAKRAAEKTGT